VAYHRNNELLTALDAMFNAGGADFFAPFAFELDTDAALNWYISAEEKAGIAGKFDAPVPAGAAGQLRGHPVGPTLAALTAWFGTGGR